MKLPASVQEIADVIGRERTLYLIGQLPRTYQSSTKKPAGGIAERVILYIPKALRPDHPLVKILGWKDAAKLASAFGGEVMQPANCRDIYRRFRDRSIQSMLDAGEDIAAIAELMGISERHVKNLSKEKAQEEKTGSNDNTRANNHGGSTWKPVTKV